MQGKVLPEPNAMAGFYAGIDMCVKSGWMSMSMPLAEAFASPMMAAADDVSTENSARSG